jgi:PAS domain S-box-containing protein
MKFLRRKGLIIFTSLFALLLVVHTVLTISENKTVKHYIASDNPAVTHNLNEQEKTTLATEIASGLNNLLMVQLLLTASGLPLLFMLTRNIVRSEKKLAEITNELYKNNNTLIFSSSENGQDQTEATAQRGLVKNLKKVHSFIKSISEGHYGISWEGLTEANKEANRDSIAGALLHMRDQMQLVKEQDQIRMWTTEGLSKFGEVIRTHQDNFDKLSENLISNVVKYVDAKVGGLFILEEDETTNQKFLLLRASYAYDRKKYISKRIEIGQGIVGQCYLEAQTVYMAKVPNNYLSITSGLGGANPNSLLVIPLRTNDKIEGVLELASLKPFQPHEITFLEKLGELLASSIITVRTSEKTSRLLRISQEQAEEMRSQEEEMRQNMEELEATQEQMGRTMSELATLKASLEKEKYLLDSLMDNIPDAIYFKDRESRFIRVSKYLASHFGGNVEKLIGKSDFDFQDKARAQQAYDDEVKIMATRKPMIDYVEKEVMTDGSEHWVSTTKMPLIDSKGEVVGTFGISRDITRLKKLENDVLNRDKSLDEEKKHYEDKIKSLENQLKA